MSTQAPAIGRTGAPRTPPGGAKKVTLTKTAAAEKSSPAKTVPAKTAPPKVVPPKTVPPKTVPPPTARTGALRRTRLFERILDGLAWLSVVAPEFLAWLSVVVPEYALAGPQWVWEVLSRRGKARTEGWLAFGLVAAAIVALAGAGITWVTSPYWGHHETVTQAPARNVGVVPLTKDSQPAPLAALSPNRIEIPKLGASAPIVNVTTLPNNELEVPLNPKIVGWWQWGAKPGATTGTAILDGHINYAGVEGVLARIGTLNPGDTVIVYGLDHGTSRKLTFTITGVRTYSKQALPYQEIFDQKSVGRLALVTCGGPFDASTGNYEDNIVAYAVAAGGDQKSVDFTSS